MRFSIIDIFLLLKDGFAMLKYDAAYIRFISGHRSNTMFYSKGENLLQPSAMNPSAAPLCFTDFKSVEVLNSVFIRDSIIRCTFKDGEDAAATVSHSMLKVLCAFTALQENQPVVYPKYIPLYYFFVAPIGIFLFFALISIINMLIKKYA